MVAFKSLKLHCLSTALSPITHMMGTSGNEAIINRSKIMSGGDIVDIPVLSGNAIRHKMIREPGANYLIHECGLQGKLTIDQANYLFYGGNLTEGSAADNLSKIAAMYELMPLYRLIGGALRNQIVSGSLIVSMGYLVCEQARELIGKFVPAELMEGVPELRPCEDFVSNWQYVRGDISKRPDIIKPGETPPEKSNQMIYNGQHVIPNAVFYHQFSLQDVSRLEAGALFAAIDDWQQYDGHIGGAGRIGHGQLDTKIYISDTELEPEILAAEYRGHMAEHRDEIAAWLDEAFPAVGKKAAK